MTYTRDWQEAEIYAIMERAARSGAERALERVGLHDDKAVRDIVELRQLLDAWRVVRIGSVRFMLKMVALIILGALAVISGKHIMFSP